MGLVSLFALSFSQFGAIKLFKNCQNSYFEVLMVNIIFATLYDAPRRSLGYSGSLGSHMALLN